MWQEQHTEKATRADEPRVISKKERDAFHGMTFMFVDRKSVV